MNQTSKSAFRKSSPKRFYDVNDAPNGTHVLNPLSKQAHDRDKVPDFYTQTSRVTAQPPSFLCDYNQPERRKSMYNSKMTESRTSNFMPQNEQSSPILAQMKLRSFYEQHGQRVARPLTMIDPKQVEGFNYSRNSPALEYKNKDMLKIEMAMRSNNK